jgi:hypothetical protein
MRDFHFQLRTPTGLQSAAITICCEGPEIAFMEACRIIPGIAGEMLREGHDPMACEFIIRNAKGEEMFTVPFSELIRPTPARARH